MERCLLWFDIGGYGGNKRHGGGRLDYGVEFWLLDTKLVSTRIFPMANGTGLGLRLLSFVWRTDCSS